MSRELSCTTDNPLSGKEFGTVLTKYLSSYIMTGIFRQITSVRLAPKILISHIITISPRLNVLHTRMVTDIP